MRRAIIVITERENMMMPKPHVLRTLGCCLALAMAGMWISACAQPRTPDVEYVPTPHNVVAEMLRLAEVKRTDMVYDLGCGDGRVVIAAAKQYGARGIGVDIDPKRIKESHANARQAGVVERVKFLQQDLFATDIREATVVTLYLLPQLNRQLRPKLLSDLRPGTRIVSHDFDMGDWYPDKTLRVPGASYEHTLFYWVIPADVSGVWRLTASAPTGNRQYTLRLQQQFQEVRGTATGVGEETPITNATLMGDHLRFTVTTGIQGEQVKMSFDGRITGNAMRGNVEVQGGVMAGRYAWTSQREAASTTSTPQR
jgi:SAM-dependent methyltransferase